jgi:hypothetical protein
VTRGYLESAGCAARQFRWAAAEFGLVAGLVVAKLDEIATAKEIGSLLQNVNYVLKSSFVLYFLEIIPDLRGKLSQPKKQSLNEYCAIEDQMSVASWVADIVLLIIILIGIYYVLFRRE